MFRLIFGLDISLVIFVLAILFSTAAYVRYFRDHTKEIILPNRWSWLIWSVATIVEALTYQAVSDDWIKSLVFFLGAFCSLGITVLIWSRAKWEHPSWTEIVCVIASGLALILWLQFEFTLWAHLLMVLAVPISFVPTWKNAAQNPNNEKSHAWMLWSVGDLLTLLVIAIRLDGIEELPFIIVELVSHVITWRMVRTHTQGIWYDH